MNLRKLWMMALAMTSMAFVTAQSINSPYSSNGLGEILFQGLPHNYAMGEVGIGSPTVRHINLLNPALLTYNSLSTFQVGLSGDFRNYESELGQSRDQAASLRFLAFSFPVVANRWTSAFALLPLSTVNYNTFSQDTLENANSITQFQGDGGLTQLTWANGIRLYKTLSLGMKATYTFGSIDRHSRVQVGGPDVTPTYAISYVESTDYSDLNFSVALAYRMVLGEQKYLHIGATHELSKTLDGSEDRYFARQTFSGATIQRQILAEDVRTEFTLPRTYGLGLSYERLNLLRIGADVIFQDWGKANEDNVTDELRNIFNLAAGAEWIPDYQSVNSYFKRTSYRVGFNLKQLPYLVNNKEVNDFGINFGASFPVSGYSSLDAAFKYGWRGTTDNNLIRENYFQVVIGATINDRWFIKRRYD